MQWIAFTGMLHPPKAAMTQALIDAQSAEREDDS